MIIRFLPRGMHYHFLQPFLDRYLVNVRFSVFPLILTKCEFDPISHKPHSEMPPKDELHPGPLAQV